MNRLRGASAKSPAAKALYDKHLPAYIKLLEDCAKNGATAQERGDARLDLLSLRKASLDVEARVAILRGLFTDKFMHNSVRARAVSSLPAYCVDADGNTDSYADGYSDTDAYSVAETDEEAHADGHADADPD